MIEPAPQPTPVPQKRGKGRPIAGENNVGRERLLAAAEKLLRTMPPAHVTISRIAREANADPALVRYYFGNRTALLLAVVDRVTAHAQRDVQRKEAAGAALASHIGKTVQLVRSAPFMHRLMIDELAQVGTEESRAHVRDMNRDLIDYYSSLLGDAGGELIEADPLLLLIVILGASDFFSSAEPLIRELLPDDTDMADLTARFQTFFSDLVLNGLRRR